MLVLQVICRQSTLGLCLHLQIRRVKGKKAKGVCVCYAEPEGFVLVYWVRGRFLDVSLYIVIKANAKRSTWLYSSTGL